MVGVLRYLLAADLVRLIYPGGLTRGIQIGRAGHQRAASPRHRAD
ncbi:MAG TPA: hypothetical protein VKV35_05070 [Streptosporangiaceae bacterium]|nr:hypothetical protein [Streptosporangiaceae bacterium]